MLAVAVASLLFQLTLQLPSGDEHFVRIDRSGWAVAELQRPTSMAPFERLWSWSPSCAPALTESTEQPSPCAATRRLSIRVADQRRRATAGRRLVWGTRSMIEQIPDALLPSVDTGENGVALIEAPTSEAVFCRIAGPDMVSDWQRLEPGLTRAQIGGVDATEVRMEAVDAVGHAAARVRALISFADVKNAYDLPLLAAADKGNICLRLPSAGTFALVAWSDQDAPLELTAPAPDLKGTLTLPPGCRVRGTVVRKDAKSIAGAEVGAVFRLGKTPRAWRRQAITDDAGHFDVRGITCGVSVLSVSKKSFARVRRELMLAEPVTDLGRVALAPSRSTRVTVLDAKDGKPVAGARVHLKNALLSSTTNAEGVAVVDGIADDEAEIEVASNDYLPEKAALDLASKERQVVRLTRAAVLKGTVVRRDDHRPAGPGTLWIDLSGQMKIEHFGADGQIRAGGLAGGLLKAEVRVPGLASQKLAQREIAAGASIDLGAIELDRGAAVTGSVIDAATSAPIEARIRLPRPNPSGPRLSLVMKDWIETAADENGQFQLGGLHAGDYRLLVEASGYAPALTKQVTVAGDDAATDAGVVRLDRSRRLAVTCRPAKRCGSQVQLLLGDPNDDWASVFAAMSEGKGEIIPAPAGHHWLRLVDRGAIIAEREIDSSPDDAEDSVEIVLPEIELRGEVARGGRPVSAGSVQFAGHADRGGIPIMIDRKVGSAVVDQDIVGVVPRLLIVPVDEHGTFVTRDLGPGRYTITYSGAAGTSPEQEIEVPDASSYAFRIDLPATALRGTIAVEGGKIPDWARVEVRGGAGVVSADMMPDGHFSIDGVPPGAAVIHAFNDDATADREIVIDANRDAEVDLVLRQRSRRQIRFTAFGSNGAPARSAQVFVLCDGALKSAAVDAAGSASLTVPANARTCLGAGFSTNDGWAFSSPLSTDGQAESIESVLRFSPRAVTLAVESDHPSGVFISNGSGFPVDRVFPLIGWPAMTAPSQPLRVRGLPPGTYRVSLSTGAGRIMVVDGTKDVTAHF